MKRTDFPKIVRSSSGILKLFSAVILTFAFAVCAQAQIIYTPSEAIQVVKSLDTSDPLGQASHDFGTAGVTHGSGSKSVNQASDQELMSLSRKTYYSQLIHELEIESQINNTTAGTQNALNRVYNRLLPSTTNNARYPRVIAINNELQLRLQK